MRYIIITPVYNEEKYLDIYISSIINQTTLPKLLLLVDDNSTDNSLSIMKKYSKKFKWIKYIYHPSEPKKIQGSKVIEAFNYGLMHVEKSVLGNVEIISKIDADLELPNNYFQSIIESFKRNDKIGLVGGNIVEYHKGKWITILSNDYHVRGALKSYRKACFIEIGGFIPVLGWDGLDEMKAMYKGWETKNININVKHYRIASSDYNPIWLEYKLGNVNYINGGNLFLAIIRAIVRFKKRPYIIVGIAFILGYLNAMIKRKHRIVDKEFAKFINYFHFKRILLLLSSKVNNRL